MAGPKACLAKAGLDSARLFMTRMPKKALSGLHSCVRVAWHAGDERGRGTLAFRPAELRMLCIFASIYPIESYKYANNTY